MSAWADYPRQMLEKRIAHEAVLATLAVERAYELLGEERCGSAQGLRILALGSVNIAGALQRHATKLDELLAIDMDAAQCEQLQSYCNEVWCADFFRVVPDPSKRADLIVMRPNEWVPGSTIDHAILKWLAPNGVLVAIVPPTIETLVDAIRAALTPQCELTPIEGTKLMLLTMKMGAR
jgi:hypothetical protein